jgi:hypothetical protein
MLSWLRKKRASPQVKADFLEVGRLVIRIADVTVVDFRQEDQATVVTKEYGPVEFEGADAEGLKHYFAPHLMGKR